MSKTDLHDREIAHASYALTKDPDEPPWERLAEWRRQQIVNFYRVSHEFTRIALEDRARRNADARLRLGLISMLHKIDAALAQGAADPEEVERG